MADDQHESIVTTFDRPIIVLAGTGARKTFLIGDNMKLYQHIFFCGLISHERGIGGESI
jgi:hypothetical protein